MTLDSIPCLRCSEPVAVIIEHSKSGAVCQKCIESEERQKRVQRRREEMSRNWLAICPPAYVDTKLDQLPCPEKSTLALDWPYGVRGAKCIPGKGLNLWGWPRTGKTRTMFLILQREYFAGRSIKFFGPSEFSDGCELRNFKSAAWIATLCNYDILSFDDIDKCKMRNTHEEKFFAVVDRRMRRLKPTFYTGNSSGEVLTTKFKNGAALIARMREQCVSIHFPNPQKVLL